MKILIKAQYIKIQIHATSQHVFSLLQMNEFRSLAIFFIVLLCLPWTKGRSFLLKTHLFKNPLFCLENRDRLYYYLPLCWHVSHLCVVVQPNLVSECTKTRRYEKLPYISISISILEMMQLVVTISNRFPSDENETDPLIILVKDWMFSVFHWIPLSLHYN